MEELRTNLIKELENRGYKASATFVNKNGIEMQGIRMEIGSVSPVVNMEVLEKMEFENAIKFLIDSIKTGGEFDNYAELLSDVGYVYNHLLIGIERKMETETVSRKSMIPNLQEYLYVNLGNATARVKSEMLSLLGIPEDRAWDFAMGNMEDCTQIRTMVEIMEETYGVSIPEQEPQMYIVSNNNNVKGAANVLCRYSVTNYAREKGIEKFVVIPSSIHECILLNATGLGFDGNDINQMINDVNIAEVDETERLLDSGFLLDVDEWKFTSL